MSLFSQHAIDKYHFFGIIIVAVFRSELNMQWYRRGHNEHDWKSCCRQKRHEGSNPSHCAKNKGRHQKVTPFIFGAIKARSEIIRSFDKLKTPVLGRLTQENTRHKRRFLRRNLRCGALPDIEYACGAASWLCTKSALFWCEAVLPKQVRDKIDCKNSRILTYAGIFSGDFSRTGTGKTVCFLMSVGL